MNRIPPAWLTLLPVYERRTWLWWLVLGVELAIFAFLGWVLLQSLK